MILRHPILFLLLITAVSYAADAPPLSAPNKAATRQQINDLIAQSQKQNQPATLGLVQQSIALSISFGAPTWNQGDHAACCNFYQQTAQSLSDVFSKNASPLAAVAINDLQSALARTKSSSDVDKNAWTLRFAFDKTQLTVDSECIHASELLQLGDQYLKRADFDTALEAFSAVNATLTELHGLPQSQIPIQVRIAPIASANALFGQKKYHDAAIAVTKGLQLVPELATSNIDLRIAYGDPLVYKILLDDLQANVDRSPKDVDLHLLLAYQLFFTGRKDEAKTLLNETLQLDPNNIAAKLLLNPRSPSVNPSDHANPNAPQL